MEDEAGVRPKVITKRDKRIGWRVQIQGFTGKIKENWHYPDGYESIYVDGPNGLNSIGPASDVKRLKKTGEGKDAS